MLLISTLSHLKYDFHLFVFTFEKLTQKKMNNVIKLTIGGVKPRLKFANFASARKKDTIIFIIHT